MNAPIAPGVVTSLSPFLVQLGADGVAQPCQRVAPAQIGQRGGVLILGGQRVWLGAYDKNDIDVSGLVPWTIYQDDVNALQAATADTGWQTVTLLSGFTGSLAYRIVGPVVHWAGKVARTAGAYPITWTQIATIPSAAIPTKTGEYSISGRAPTGAMQCDIYSSGALRVSGTGTSTEAVFSGLTWL